MSGVAHLTTDVSHGTDMTWQFTSYSTSRAENKTSGLAGQTEILIRPSV